jgi:LacI family transcriptional regulator
LGFITTLGQRHDAVAFDLTLAQVTVARTGPGRPRTRPDAVLADNTGGIDQAVDHLVRQGHTRIAYLGDDERIFTARERVIAFRAAMRRHRLDAVPRLCLAQERPRRLGIRWRAMA